MEALGERSSHQEVVSEVDDKSEWREETGGQGSQAHQVTEDPQPKLYVFFFPWC